MADVEIVIYDSAIAAMSLPGGSVWKFAHQRRTRVERIAKSTAPVRTGDLRAGIYATFEPAKPKNVIMEVHSGAGHSLWVHEGTKNNGLGYIRPRNAKRLILPAGYGHRRHSLKKVHGQRANPWLRRALQEVMRDL